MRAPPSHEGASLSRGPLTRANSRELALTLHSPCTHPALSLHIRLHTRVTLPALACIRHMRDAFGTCGMHSVHAGCIRYMRDAFGTCGTHSVHAGCIAAARGLPNSVPGTRDARGADAAASERPNSAPSTRDARGAVAAASGLPRYNMHPTKCPNSTALSHEGAAPLMGTPPSHEGAAL